MLDRILRGDDHERLRKFVRRVADRDLPLLHRFEQRRLHFRRRAIDLIGQNQVRENRPLPRREDAIGRIEDQRPGDIGRQKVRRELDAMKRRVDSAGQRLDEQRLGKSGNALEQHMPADQQRDDEPVDDRLLPDHRTAHLGSQFSDHLMR